MNVCLIYHRQISQVQIGADKRGFISIEDGSVYLPTYTAAPSFGYFVQLHCQCKGKRKTVGDNRRHDKRHSISAEKVKFESRIKAVF